MGQLGLGSSWRCVGLEAQEQVSQASPSPAHARRKAPLGGARADHADAAHMARRFAPPFTAGAEAPQVDTPPVLLALPPGIRNLIALLLVLALLPSLTMTAMFWSGVLTLSSHAPAAVPGRRPLPAAKPASLAGAAEADEPGAQPAAVLTAPATLEATAGETVTFTVALDGTDAVPAHSFIAVSGLPQGAALSDGRPYGDSGWSLGSDEIGDLHLVLPGTAAGESRLTVQLIAPGGEVLTSAETTLEVAAAAPEAGEPPQPLGDPAPTAALPAAQGIPEQAQEPDAPAAEVKAGEAPATDPDAETIVPSTFVNLRDGPTASAATIGVIAKGTKLTVVARKRRWVKVTDPSSSTTGWVYARYLAPDGKPRYRYRRTVAKPAAAETKSSPSVWTRLGNWLTGQ
jgi:hypothetical protein